VKTNLNNRDVSHSKRRTIRVAVGFGGTLKRIKAESNISIFSLRHLNKPFQMIMLCSLGQLRKGRVFAHFSQNFTFSPLHSFTDLQF
jgi:hypothetical protein